MEYQGIVISKKESEVIKFLQTGSNEFHKAFYIYTQRKQNFRNVLPIVTWFNSIIKSLHSKGLFLEIPFVIHSTKMNWSSSWYGYFWMNPGINASKANFECFTLHDAQMEMKSEQNKII